MGIEGDINSPSILVFIKHFLPSLAAVGGAEDTAFRIRTERMAQRRHVYDLGIPGVDNQLSDGARIPQGDVLPRLATIQRFVDPIAMRNVATNACLSRADINDARLRRRHSQAANAPDSFFIKKRGPRHGAVGRLPYSAAGRPKVIGVRVPRESRRCQRAPPAEGTDR